MRRRRTPFLARASSALALAVMLAAAAASTTAAAPSVSLDGIDELTGVDASHVDGSTLWVRSGSTGTFRLRATATSDNPGGVSYVEFPTIGAGWQPQAALQVTTPPYELSYAWTALAADPATPSDIAAVDPDPATATTQLQVRVDGAPPTGTNLIAQTTATRDSSAPVSADLGSDAGSGIGTWQYRRRSSSIANDVCTGWGSWSDVGGADLPGFFSDPLPSEGCYQYGIVVADHVGNAASVTQSGWLRVDRSLPLASIDAIDPAQVHGGNSVQLVGNAWDARTSIRSVTVLVADRYSICNNAPVDASGRWSCTWDIDYTERTGPATIRITVTDQAGNRTFSTQDVDIQPPPSPFGPRDSEIDRTPPVVGLARMPLTSWRDHVRVKATAFDDRGGYVEVRLQQRVAKAQQVRFGRWRPAAIESQEVILEERGETTCYRAIAIDEVGNQAVSAPRCTTLPLDDSDLFRRGRWDEVEHRRAWQGSMQRTTRRGSSMFYRVADPTPLVLVTKCRGCGTIRVFHGRRVVGTYSLRARRTQFRRIIKLPRLRRPLSAPLRIVSLTNRKPVYVDALVAGR